MTAIQIQGPTLALDPATRSTLLQTVVDCLPHIPNASEAERTAKREAAFALVEHLAPTGPVEAMIAAEAIAAHYASVNAYRTAARSDLPYDLQRRYLTRAGSLARLSTAKRRELVRHQAAQPTLPAATEAAAFGAARAAQASAIAPGVPAGQATPAPLPEAAADELRLGGAAEAAARGGFVPPTQAEIAQLAAGFKASHDAQVAAAKRGQAGAAAADPEDEDDLAEMSEAEVEAVVARARALVAETAEPAEDMGELLQAEVAARAAAAMKLAA